MSHQTLIILVLLLALFSHARAAPRSATCSWRDADGNYFDFTPLQKKPYWQITDDLNGMGLFSMVYTFNFCTFQGLKCGEEQVTVYESLEIVDEITDNCDVIARSKDMAVSRIDENDASKGLKIVYTGGDVCFREFWQNDQSGGIATGEASRQATFLLTCADNGQDDDTFTVDSNDPCETVFRMRTRVACVRAAKATHSSFQTLMLVLFVAACYFGGGYYYKHTTLGVQGVDAVPHAHFWLDFPYLVRDGVRFTVEKGTHYARKGAHFVQARTESAASRGYSDV